MDLTLSASRKQRSRKTLRIHDEMRSSHVRASQIHTQGIMEFRSRNFLLHIQQNAHNYREGMDVTLRIQER